MEDIMKPNYKNPGLPIKERVEDLLSRMTVEEKVAQMTQVSVNMVSAEEADVYAEKGIGSFLHSLGDTTRRLKQIASNTRLGIPLIFGIDAIHGHSLHNGCTMYPSQLGVSCSWDEEKIHEMGKITAREAAEEGLHWLFSPVLCVGRDLRWGRIDETFGEDPYLIGELGYSIIRGYQSENLAAACAKHYLGYGESVGARDSYDSQISDRKIRECFLPPFKRAVEAESMTFMVGYESIDGLPMSANRKFLRDVLKDELGFAGFSVTDWCNIEGLHARQFVANDLRDASKIAVEAGNDMSMNSLGFMEHVIDMAKSGELDMKYIDDSVRRILAVKFKLGLFDGIEQRIPHGCTACEEHITACKTLTDECPVLLENNGILPLGSKYKKIAVIGPNADNVKAQYGDWTYFSHPDANPNAVPKEELYTMLRGIKTVFSDAEVRYTRGCDVMDPTDQNIEEAVALANDSDVVVAVLGDCLDQNGESKDRCNLEITGAQLDLLKQLKATGKPVVVILVNGKPLCIGEVRDNCDALLETFNSGAYGGLSAAKILRGDCNPEGKLTISFPRNAGQIPVYYNQYAGWHSNPKTGGYCDCPPDALYPFGYGLSYNNYTYANMQVSKTTVTPDDTIEVSVDITNNGGRDGNEIVQLYVNDKVSSVCTPVKQLRGFQRAFIKAGQTVTVTIPLSVSDLWIVNREEEYIVEAGEFELMIGKSSLDRDLLTQTIRCTETRRLSSSC